MNVLGEATSAALSPDAVTGSDTLSSALSLIDRAKGLSKDEKRKTQAIVRRLGEAVEARMERAGSEAERQACLGAATSAEIVLKKLLKSKADLVQAARCDADILVAYIYDNGGSAMRRQVDQKAEGLFDDLLTIVADGLIGLAETSENFFRNTVLIALENHDSLKGGQKAVTRLAQGHGQDPSKNRTGMEALQDGSVARTDDAILKQEEEPSGTAGETSEAVDAGDTAAEDRLHEVSKKLNDTSGYIVQGLSQEPYDHDGNIRFGISPTLAKGFIDRREQAELRKALSALGLRHSNGQQKALESVDADNAGLSPDSLPVVLCGMRGAGKSQLAAAYAHDCEQAGWPLVAWIDASGRDALVTDLAKLAHTMGIDDRNPEALARDCIAQLNAGRGDRLIVFDNVEDFDDLTGLIPQGQGLRVLVTSTAIPNANVGRILVVGAFTRPESVDFLVERTGLDDAEGADRLAEALGDLPIALGQAAATITLDGYSTIDEYLTDLHAYRLEEVVDSFHGDDCPALVDARLRTAYESVLNLLADKDRAGGEEDLPRVGAASVQLAALALLAPSGVPRTWLHRIGKRMPIARQALGALAAHSICTPSEDGRYIRIHSLQGRVLREDYNKQPEVFDILQHVVVDLLEGIDMDNADTNDAQRTDALDMADQLRAIAEQQQGQARYSPHEARIDLSSLAPVLNYTMISLNAAGLPQTTLTLEDAVDMLTDVLGPDHPRTLIARNNLALAHQEAGHVSTAIDMYQALLPDLARAPVLGPDHPDTLTTRNNLAGAHQEAGHVSTAIDMYQALLPDLARAPVLGPDHPDTLTTRNNLAGAHQEAGHVSTAIDMYEGLLPDMAHVLGPDHPDTLTVRNNLALAHRDAGSLQKAIDMYEAVLADRTRVLGPDHPDTLTVRNNLAGAHQEAGHVSTAIDMYEAVLADRTRVLGPDHPDTLTVRNNLAGAHQEAGHVSTAIAMYQTLLPDLASVLGPDHPHTLTTRNNLAGAHQEAGNLPKAIAMYQTLLPDLASVLGPDHPHTLATRGSLATAHRQAGNVSTAIAMYEALLTDMTRLLGPDHPDTLATRNNLADAHQEAGHVSTAIAMYEALLAGRTRILGPDHPDTLATESRLVKAIEEAS